MIMEEGFGIMRLSLIVGKIYMKVLFWNTYQIKEIDLIKHQIKGEAMTHTIHLKAPSNWINDPNGFIYYKGLYHLFYQHFPYEPRWGRMHWGHAVSKDLVHWEHQKIALFPSKYDDRSGCYSGSAVEYQGKLYLYYTGMNYLEENPEDINLCYNNHSAAAQMMVTSEDGFRIDNIRDKRRVIPPIEDPEVGDKKDTRDPKVWRGKGGWYMVLGSRTPDHQGKLLIYRSRDLENWEFVNSAGKDRSWGTMWECPDYFQVGGQGILMMSPMGILDDGVNAPNQSVWALADFHEETCSMEIGDSYYFFDHGLDLYAPQSTLDQEGRRIITAWARMPEPVGDSQSGWSGMFCVPRVVEVKEGHVYFRPHPYVKRAFTRKLESPRQAGEEGCRVELDLEDGDWIDIGGYVISRQGKKIRTDRTKVYPEGRGYGTAFETPPLREGFHVDIYVDPNLIEVYANDGEYVISNVVYGLGKEIRANRDREIEVLGV